MSRPVILDRREAEALLDLMDVWEKNPEHEETLTHLNRRREDYLKHLSKRSEL